MHIVQSLIAKPGQKKFRPDQIHVGMTDKECNPPECLKAPGYWVIF